MRNKVIIVGDSFTFGQGCSDRIAYHDQKTKTFVGTRFTPDTTPSNLNWVSIAAANYKDYNFVNLAKPGYSNDKIFQTWKESANTEVALVIFAGTFDNRMMVKRYDSDKYTVSWLIGYTHDSFIAKTIPTAYIRAQEEFVKHLYHQDILENATIMSVLAAKALANNVGAKFIWSLPRMGQGAAESLNDSIFKLDDIATKQFDAMHTYHSKFEKLGYNLDDIGSQCGHFNEEGHEIYYKQVIQPVLQGLLK